MKKNTNNTKHHNPNFKTLLHNLRNHLADFEQELDESFAELDEATRKLTDVVIENESLQYKFADLESIISNLEDCFNQTRNYTPPTTKVKK